MAKRRLMYIECKTDVREAHIGRVAFSKTRKSIHYRGRTFETLGGVGFVANYFDVETSNHYWISGCKKNGEDTLHGERVPIFIDDDVREEYWVKIRNQPENKRLTRIN